MAQPRIAGHTLPSVLMICIVLFGGGCQVWTNDADREVYRLIESRQQAALGATSNTRLPEEDKRPPSRSSRAYQFVPHPITSEVPEEFQTASHREPSGSASLPTTRPSALPSDKPTTESTPTTMATTTMSTSETEDVTYEQLYFGPESTLAEALAYAVANSREFQSAREDLYLQALALTLERHLWTPRFMSTLQSTYTEYPDAAVPERTVNLLADLAVEQKLPYGGEVVAKWVGTMVRDLQEHVTSSEGGQLILEANMPLLRGGGQVAFESRYQAERDLIYAVRDFEDFRRSFVTQIAGEYFELLSTKSSIRNAIASRDSSRDNWERSQALADAEKIVRLEADRARVDYLQARNRVVNAIEAYESALDEFKIRIGMPTTDPFDVVDRGVELAEPQVDQPLAIDTALKQRLDLLNTLDAVDDARRQVEIARNNLLPDLNLTGSVSYDTPDDHLSMFGFREHLETWTAGGTLELPLDRKEERNRYRSSIIGYRRAERNYDLAADRVRLEVRRALRRIEQARFSLAIQDENIRSNEIRREAAQVRFELGQLSNRDVVDADNDLRDARDEYARALSEYRQAILAFREATGTLRVGDDGRWLE
ncbi:MAG: hypothetical protein HJJLKODD_01174 [Phycisphaerae bacterium]|nr:hypothetical protein [Phycisphaerae bacterium]